MNPKVLILPGDGIGVDVCVEAEEMLKEISAQHGLNIEISHALIGGAAMDATGVPLARRDLGGMQGSRRNIAGRCWRPEMVRSKRGNPPGARSLDPAR